MANANIFFEIILLLLFTFIIGIEEFDDYPQIKEFEKKKVSINNDTFKFQYSPKEIENIAYSDLVLHLDNNLNVNYQSVIEICLYNTNHYYLECILVNISDSSSIYLDKSIIPDITKISYISFFPNYYYFDYDDTIDLDYDYNFPESYEYLEFYFFFINHEIPLNINNNTYIFNFDINGTYVAKEYSQDYFKFKLPLYQNDKILKIKIKLKNKKENDLFTITNISSIKEISYNTELFSNKLDTSKSEYLIKINYLPDIEFLYISLDEEIIDLSNIINQQFFIFQTQRFYINLTNENIGFFICPFETVENGTIIFYDNNLEKYKERELESEKTTFYIEKINDNSEYYIDINTKSYVVYKFILMENFEIINETKKVAIPPLSTKYLIFPYYIEKEKNNNYYYGINIGDTYNSERYIEIIRENKENIDLPTYPELLLLSKYHIIIKIVSWSDKELLEEIFYSNYTYNNIKIYNAKNKNPELMNLINNKGFYNNEEIKECILLYDFYWLQYIGFQGFGNLSYYYNNNLNFNTIEKGFNFNLFNTKINYGKIYYDYIVIYLYVKANSFFETYSSFKLEEQNINNNFFILNSKNPIPFKSPEKMIISFKSINRYNIKVNITFNNNEKSYSVNDEYDFLYIGKNEEILIKTSGLVSFYLIKQVQNKDIQFLCFNKKYKYMKVVIPYIEDNYNFTFYKGYALARDYIDIDIDTFYANSMKELNIPLNYSKEIRLYFKNEELYNKDGKDFPYKIIYNSYFYGFIYPKTIEARKISNINSSPFGIYSSYFFGLPNKYNFFMCKNTKVYLYIANNHNFLFSKIINESTFLDFSNYNNNDILEIEAYYDYLFLKSECYLENNKIKDLNDDDEYNDTQIFLDYEKTDSCPGVIKYIFAPKTDFFMKNFQNECYIYNLIKRNIKNENILITTKNDFKEILQKDYKEYLVTVVNDGNDYEIKYPQNIVIYKPIIINVSQTLLDRFFPPSESSEPSKPSESSYNIILFFGFIILLFIVLIFVMNCKDREKNDSLKIDEKINEMQNLDLD